MGADNKEPDVWKRVFQPGANPGPQPRDGSHDRVSIVHVRVILKHHHRYAVTVRIRPGVVPGTEPAPSHAGMWDFMGTLPADLPKIVVVEDLTKPVIYGSMWGEVNATYYKAAGAVGCITDGGVRDLQEMKNVGFHAMSRGVTISHAFGVSIGRFKTSQKC